PVLSYDNSRLLPESYSGTLITSKEIEGLELNAGRFTAESRKSAEGRDSGGLKSINVFGGKYAFTDHFNASLYASDVEDVLKKQYINLNYTIPL
ncbi:OprD family porin, partial [Listeria monocytogenes]|nr:OprD family porin [Listeria monocytogenes]